VANLRFTARPVPGGDRTIDLQFVRGVHGDAYAFDGRGRVLAHAFYPAPPNPEPRAGDLHLDLDEAWGIGAPTDLFTVVLHELGHALGLGHSDQPGAVMYPYYRAAAGLAADDIEGIRSLYGGRQEGDRPQAPPGPRLSITSPPAASTVAAATVPLRGVASGGVEPVIVRWESDRGPAGPASGSPEWRVDHVPLAEGPNRLTVTATDAAGSAVRESVTVTRLSSAPPAVPAAPLSLRITSPALTISSTRAASLTLRGTSTGAARVVWSSQAGLSGEAGGLAAWTAEAPLYVGTNTITVRAVSESGASVWRAVTVVRR
jgi:hypothetical protein